MHNIEISIPIEFSASIAFWIDKAEWEAMTEEQRKTAIIDRVESVCYELQSDVLRFNRATVSAEIINPGEVAEVDLEKVETYDPKEGEVHSRPTESSARAAVEAWLDVHAPGYPTYSLHKDGEDGWAFYVAEQDTTSYLRHDMSIEWYGTGWPRRYEYDEGSGGWSVRAA